MELKLKERLTAYLEAEKKILAGQSYRLADRELRRADLSEVRKAIDDLTAQIARLECSGGQMKRAVFI